MGDGRQDVNQHGFERGVSSVLRFLSPNSSSPDRIYTGVEFIPNGAVPPGQETLASHFIFRPRLGCLPHPGAVIFPQPHGEGMNSTLPLTTLQLDGSGCHPRGADSPKQFLQELKMLIPSSGVDDDTMYLLTCHRPQQDLDGLNKCSHFEKHPQKFILPFFHVGSLGVIISHRYVPVSLGKVPGSTPLTCVVNRPWCCCLFSC